MNVFLRHITQSVLMVESDIALVVYNHSLGISHGYVQLYMYVALVYYNTNAISHALFLRY